MISRIANDDPRPLKGQTSDVIAVRLATLYGDLDHTHGFHEGNSRTRREFTRVLALAADYRLDWTRRPAGTKERNEQLSVPLPSNHFDPRTMAGRRSKAPVAR